MSEGCRVDVWLWRARFAKTRSQAAAFIDSGAVRLTHQGRQARVDKPSRCVHLGDLLVFARGGRLIELVVLDLGERRGPANEAQGLYRLSETPAPDASA